LPEAVVGTDLVDLGERVGRHGDHVVTRTVAQVPQGGDLDRVAGQDLRSVHDPQLPVHACALQPEVRGGLTGQSVPDVLDGGDHLNDVRRQARVVDHAPLISVPRRNQTHGEIRSPAAAHNRLRRSSA
jgi:hypothetical protein